MRSAIEIEAPKPPRGRAAVFAVVAVVAATIAYYLAFGSLTFQPKTFEFDLVPFYCGGEVVLDRGDPYRVEPLRSCEHRVVTMFRKGTPLAIPAPQPAYVLAAMSAIHVIPYRALQVVWAILEILAFLLTVRLLAKMLSISRWIVWAALGFSDLYCSFILGQFAAFCTLGIVLAGWGVRKRSPAFVALGLLLTSLEPHVALPLFLALLVWGGRSERLVTLATGFALLAISFAIVPVAILREYASSVLTVHALAEVSNQDQMSMTYAMHALGFAPAAAVAIAKAQYALFVSISLVAVGPLAKRYDRAFLAFAPPAFALVGGPFLHVTQMGAAIPAALALYAHAGARRYAWALWLLCVPWLNFATVLTALPLATACWAALARYAARLSPRATWLAAGGATLLEGGMSFVIAQEHFHGLPHYGRVLPSDLAEVTWKTIIDQQQHSHVLAANLAKAPTEFALLLVLASMCAPLATILQARRRVAGAVASVTPPHPSR